MECCDGRGQRSIDDFAECGEPKEKLEMSSFLCFLLINISIKLILKLRNFVIYITINLLGHGFLRAATLRQNMDSRNECIVKTVHHNYIRVYIV